MTHPEECNLPVTSHFSLEATSLLLARGSTFNHLQSKCLPCRCRCGMTIYAEQYIFHSVSPLAGQLNPRCSRVVGFQS